MSIGNSASIVVSPGSKLLVANNLFYGQVSSNFTNMSINSSMGDPFYSKPGDSLASAYTLLKGSNAFNQGSSLYFYGPSLPGAGVIGSVFEKVPVHKINLDSDYFGKVVGLTGVNSIGAYHGSLN